MMQALILCAAIYGASLGISNANDDEEKHPFHQSPRLLGGNNEVSLYSRIGYMCDTEKCHHEMTILHNDDAQEILPLEMARVGPFPGMVLHIRRNEEAVQDYGIERRAAGKVNIYHRPCCNLYGSSGSADKAVERYELIEIVGGELGKTILHQHDFAYRPVFALPSEGNKEWGKGGYWWDNHMFHHEENYEREGRRAFAGGSHGEVWKARRRCHQIIVNVGKKTKASDHHSHYHGRNQEPICDVYEELIMKRLLVGKSNDLLEAGLREIYFGDILSRNEESTSLFTSYVDHFFHQGPRTNMRDLELWVVFVNAGPSLRSLLYSPVENAAFVMYQHSVLWIQLRTGGPIKKHTDESYSVALRETVLSDNGNFADIHNKDDLDDVKKGEADEEVVGKDLLKSVLRQLFTSTSKLHERGIVHRDIKPSNIMCDMSQGISKMACRLGDFSSAYDEYASEHLYSHGPSRAEQTDEYAPPESLFGDDEWIPFDELKPESYDSWSLGIVVLELLLGTPHVFSVDKRTTAILTKKLSDEGASDEDIRRALYLSALAQFCIYQPTSSQKKNWPLREGDPLFKTLMSKTTCDMRDFHSALRARDPLGIGFTEELNPLLDLVLRLLAFDPKERLIPADALNHYYFNEASTDDEFKALEPQMLDPKLDMNMNDVELTEFNCPCGRKFDNLQSCQIHARSRKHARFCSYDRSGLPKCLNAHSMLPSHPTSGYCDIQGRRRTIEDFHTVHLHDNHQFFGVFDGHNSNFASKYASSALYKRIVKPLSDMDADIEEGLDWKTEVDYEMRQAFEDLHNGYLEAMKNIPSKSMSQSGTTATMLFVTGNAVIIASVGDSRAVLSMGASFNSTISNIDALQLTVDHVASNESEGESVKEKGGFIEKRGGTPRVNGTLVLTRSIGDAHLAEFLSRKPNVVSMTKKEVNEICRSPSINAHVDDMPCFIILASDGLWDVFSNHEAVDMVSLTLQQYGIDWKDSGAMQEAAEILTQEAYVRGSTDNIGICVVAVM